MKCLLIFTGLFISSFVPLSSIYELKVQRLDGTMISLSMFKGKKIVIYEFDGKTPDQKQLLYLDSIQRSNGRIEVLGVPILDFSGMVTQDALEKIKSDLKLSFPIVKPASVRKQAGSVQHSLFKWLTKVEENSHFDNDVIEPGQMYVISEKGMLYGILGANTPEQIIDEVLNQQINE